jgi:hypothetical protein
MYIYADFSCIQLGVDSGEYLQITDTGAGAEIFAAFGTIFRIIKGFQGSKSNLYIYFLFDQAV